MEQGAAIRVGRCCYEKGKRVDPHYPGFTTIVVLTKGTSRWGALGPYELRDDAGHIMENIWQFSKVYPRVKAVCQKKSRFEDIVVWEHPAEVHLANERAPATADNLRPEYWAWRRKGFANPHAVRYPPGYGSMAACVGSLVETHPGEYEGPLSYVESRKALYLPLYCRLARQSPLFRELRRRHKQGEKLLIAEVDGPHQESLAHYQEHWGVGPAFIDAHSVAADAAALRILLADAQHPFGHGYCLAAALQDLDADLCNRAPPAPAEPPAELADDDPLWAALGL